MSEGNVNFEKRAVMRGVAHSSVFPPHMPRMLRLFFCPLKLKSLIFCNQIHHEVLLVKLIYLFLVLIRYVQRAMVSQE